MFVQEKHYTVYKVYTPAFEKACDKIRHNKLVEILKINIDSCNMRIILNLYKSE